MCFLRSKVLLSVCSVQTGGSLMISAVLRQLTRNTFSLEILVQGLAGSWLKQGFLWPVQTWPIQWKVKQVL